MYLYNEFIIIILNDINTLSCPSKSNSKQIELTVHTSRYSVLASKTHWLKFLGENFLMTNSTGRGEWWWIERHFNVRQLLRFRL